MIEDINLVSGPLFHRTILEGWMNTEEDRKLRLALAQLKQEHRDLDEAIFSLERNVAKDQLLLIRLKKKKLVLKDEIARLEDRLLPDIIA